MRRLRTAPAAIVLLATLVAAAIFTAAPPISGDQPRETVRILRIAISATDGVTTVTEGTDLSFTITATPPPATPLEVVISLFPRGFFTDIPQYDPESYIPDPDSFRTVTVPARSNPDEQFTTAILLVATQDDDHDEDDGWVQASLLRRPTYFVDNPARQTIRVEDNDATLPPSKMNPPTVLPANRRLEIFWEEPPPPDAVETPTQGREINRYLITGAGAGNSTITVWFGHQRHLSIAGAINGQNYNVQIQACRTLAYCSTPSDVVAATPTTSGPTITSRPDGVVRLPEEIAALVGSFSAVSTTPGAITWRLGGTGSDNFSQTVSGGTMTLTMNTGVSFESRPNYGLTVVATDSSTDRASNSTTIGVIITDVDETPTFAETTVVTPTYVVGEALELRLPAPKADEKPVTYETTGLPPGLSLGGPRLIVGRPTQAGMYTAIHTATDRDGDVGTLSVQFTVVAAVNRPPTVAIQIDNQDMSPTDSPRAIELTGKFEDPDTLTYTAASGNTGVVTAAVTGSTLTLTPVAVGTATITVTATDPGGLSAFQELTVTVEEQSLTFGGMTFVPPVLYLDAKAEVPPLPEATGGSGILTYTLTKHPDNMTFDRLKRKLSGRPSVAGTFTMTYTAKDANDAVATLIIEIEVKAELLPVTGLDVKPATAEQFLSTIGTLIPIRHALLTWEKSDNANPVTRYTIYSRYPGAPETGTAVKTVSTTEFNFPLDHPDNPGENLLSKESLSVWIVAEEIALPGGTSRKANSAASETIIISDTPIISIDGDSRAPIMGRDTTPGIPYTRGKAAVKWTEQPNVTSYTIRWKELGMDRLGNPHTDRLWEMDSTSVPPDFDGTETIISTSQTTYEIQNLKLNKLYAVQLNHTRSTATGEERVFAARDFHVYPSARAAGEGERIASAPLKPQLLNKEYQYAVCVGTFPGDPVRWRAYIEHALEQWQIATNNLVKMTPALDDLGSPQQCADYGEYAQDITTDVALYVINREIVGTDATAAEIEARVSIDVHNLLKSTRDRRLVRKAQAIDPGVSEVLMFSNPIVRGMTLGTAFLQISRLVGREPCAEPDAEVPACAKFSNPFGDDEKVSVDLIFNRKVFLSTVPDLTEAHFPGGDRTPERGDIRFNSCEGTHPIYSALIHEAGHALGITGGAEMLDEKDPALSHFNPKILEAALSYGTEHGCFPHPLDIAVIYAMYQTQ